MPDLAAPWHALLDAQAKQRPDVDALIAVDALDNVERWTFADVVEASRRMAAHLRDAVDVELGDRVGIVLSQKPETVLLHLACSRLGALATPVSPLFGPKGLAARFASAKPRAVMTDGQRAGTLGEVLPDIPVRDVTDAAFDAAWRDADPLPDAAEADIEGEDAAWLLFTSATEARPKGVVLPHRVVAGRLGPMQEAHGDLGPDDVFYSPADWSWIGGLHDACLAPLCLGATVVAHERHEGFDARRAADLIDDHGVTRAFLAPSALRAFARHGPPDRTLEVAHSAGEPLAAALAAWARGRIAEHVTNVYGLTEAAFLLGTRPGDDAPPGATGRPYTGQDVRLDEGEIVVGPDTPTLMLGYWEGPDAEPRPPLEDGVFRTGDLASIEQGWWRFEARRDDVITTSGYRVGPAEVEACLMDHPAVAEAAVVGVPDEERGEVVKAYVVPDAHVDPTPELEHDLAEFVKRRLAAHVYPRRFAFVSELPRTVTGKLRRAALRDASGSG